MNKYVYRRISAFLIDIFLVTFVSTIFSSISYVNPFIENYKVAYDEYREIYKSESESVLTNPTIKNVVDYSNKMSKQIYKIDYSMLFNNIYYLVFSFLYFVLFAYFTNGQTLGKKLFKLRVVRQDGEKVKLSNLMLRTLLSGSSIFMGVNIIVVIQLLLLMISQNQVYFYAILFSSMISYVIEIIGLVLLFSKEHRSLDDIIGSTKVIDEVKYV
ncbi:rDD family protein [Firmicutes bacterium CAG:582]|nr:rDD family protein [Firmicutes bacterium CAG:582]